jgi:hypothetical protein
MSMSRKHYQEVAAILKDEIEHEPLTDSHTALRRIANELADMFKRDNSSFDRARFLRAAGLEES